MEIEDFIQRRPFLYHLTDRRNLRSIIEEEELLSTQRIVELSGIAYANEFLRTKRDDHFEILVGDIVYHIRDQQPINMNVLARSLTTGCSTDDFIYLLNGRVFFWPDVSRLERHFERYESEEPIIIRVSTADIFGINNPPQFSKINSGATRCHPYYGGNAPTRGHNTFQVADVYNDIPRSVAEVTFIGSCSLPKTICTSNTPRGRFEEVHL